MTNSENTKDQLIRGQEDVRMLAQYLDTILMHLPVGIAILEGEDFRYFRINQALADINGLSVEEHLGKTVAEIIPDSAKILSNLRKVRDQRQASPERYFTIRLPRNPDRDVHLMDFHFPIVVDGVVKAIGAVVLDVTARKQSEDELKKAYAELESREAERSLVKEALHESEARARAILDTTVDGVVTISEHGIIESFNPAAEQIFGYSEAEVIGKNVHVLMPEPYHSEHDDYIDAYKRTGQRRIIGIGREVVGRRKDGSKFPLDLAVSEVVLSNRRIFSGILRDISERRELEQAILRVAEDERRRIGQDLHDGLGQMLTGTGLIALSLARKLEALDEGASEDANKVVELIQEADAYARTISRGLVPVELDARGLDDALQRLATSAKRLFEIACTFEAHGQDVLVDVPEDVSPHLFRIAQEAVSNAAFHGKGKVVAITLSRTPEWFTLQVTDDGIGFPGLIRSAGSTRLAPVPGRRDKSIENRGMGVRIMHYRARIIGGTLEIRVGLDGGTVVTCAVPTDRTSPSP